jgi:hypothetical protein
MSKMTAVRALAILGLWSCLSIHAEVFAADPAQATGAKPGKASPDIAIDDLYGHWVHSSEEEQPGATVRIYRPAGSRAFPPSRFRMAYKFTRNGACEYYFASPDDDHRFRPCKWEVGANNGTILQVAANGTTTTYRIAELSGNILRLTEIEQRRSR